MKPVFVGKDNIMAFYDSVNPDGDLAYSVWFNNNILLQYPGEMNATKARDFLENTLDTYETNGWDKTLWLKFHPATKNAINRKTDVVIAQPIGFTEDASESIMSGNGMVVYKNGQGMNMEMFRAIKQLEDLPGTVKTTIDERFKEYDERLKAIEQPQLEDPGIMAQISGIVEKHPQIIETTLALLHRWLSGLNPIPEQSTQPAMAINGLPNMNGQANQTAVPETEQHFEPDAREVDNDKLNAALDRLQNVLILDDDLTALADFAEREPQQFQFMLNLLRTQPK